MTTTQQMICISCPVGCPLTVTLVDGKVTAVEGQGCKRGELYAQKECTNPTRIVTSSVKVSGGNLSMVPVKTQNDIPKDKIFACAAALKGLTVAAPVRIGDIILADVAGTGVNIVATRNVEQAPQEAC